MTRLLLPYFFFWLLARGFEIERRPPSLLIKSQIWEHLAGVSAKGRVSTPVAK